VSIHAPLTNETRKLIGAKELRRMKRNAYLINTARGPVVDKKALFESLKKGEIAGAGLDVFWVEPPNPHDPLFELKNVVATPHIAGATCESIDRIAKVIAENITLVMKGFPPRYLVNVPPHPRCLPPSIK
jgi:D-3-phosphoglycerate dehydrogenase